MGWASKYIKALQRGESVRFRPRGNSMKPTINSGDLVQVDPVQQWHPLPIGDAVLCKVNGREYLHKITARREMARAGSGLWYYQIGNNRGRINGWTQLVYGRVSVIER